VAIEREFHCDGPGCVAHQRTTARVPRYWLVVTEADLGGGDERHFCGWECVLRFAAQLPPPEVIPAGGIGSA